MMPFKTILIFIVLSAGFGFFSYRMYRRAVPPLDKDLRALLSALRTASLVLVGFVLLNPLLELKSNKTGKPVAVLLLDDSRSMQIVENGRSRADRERAVLHSKVFRSWKDRFNVSVFRFSDRPFLVPNLKPDSLACRGQATDIASALEGSLERMGMDRPACALILSDGVNTLGRDPVRSAEELGVPVHTLCIGEASPKPDVQITRALAARTAYSETELPVDVSIRGPGFGGRETIVTLFNGREKADEKKTTLPASGLECSVRLAFRCRTPGVQKLRVEVPVLKNELSAENNSEELAVRVLKRKMNVLMLACAPGADFAFVKRFLEENPDVELKTRTLKSPSAFYEGPFPPESGLNDTDVFVLLDVPSRKFPQAAWQSVLRAVEHGPRPFLCFAGKSIDVKRFGQFESRFPAFAVLANRETMVTPRLLSAGEGHPILRVRENRQENRAAWEKLSPVYSAWSRIEPKAGCTVLAVGAGAEKEFPGSASEVPLIVCGGRGREKAIAVFADGVFRWDLMSWGLGETNMVFKSFLENAVRWLSAEDLGKPVQFIREIPSVQAGEETVFAVQVTDELFRPVVGADVVVSFLAPPNQPEARLEEAGGGLYEGGFRPGEPGRYRAVAEARVQGRPAGRDTTEFTVLPYMPELLDTRANPDLLRSISSATGGRVIPPDSLGALAELANVQPRKITFLRRIELFDSPALLIPAGIFLILEWILRRRKGMA
jgi:hypothetical protein